jgi:8-oxo-dGTP pyrophosphatase MutT (NUDIX family)
VNRFSKIAELHKSAERKLFWHGTSSKNLRGILKEGLLPDKPPVYDDEFSRGAGTSSIKTYGGVYMTDNFGSASSASSTATARGDNKLMIGITYETRSPDAMADEDFVLPNISRIIGSSADQFFRTFKGSLVFHDARSGWGHSGNLNPDFYNKIYDEIRLWDYSDKIDDLGNILIESHPGFESRIERQKDRFYSLFRDVFISYSNHLMEVEAHRYKDENIKHYNKTIEGIIRRNNQMVEGVEDRIQDYEDLIETTRNNAFKGSWEKLRGAVDALSSAAPELINIKNDKDWRHQNLRSMAPIGFSGKNRILYVVEDSGYPNYELTFHYGGDSHVDYIAEHKKTVGSTWRAMLPSGEVVGQSDGYDEEMSERQRKIAKLNKAATDYQDEGFVGKYWGSAASGIMITDGERILLLKRSPYVENPGLWGISGGAIPRDSDGSRKDPKESAIHEAEEETGGIPSGKFVDNYVFKDGSFTFTTFLLEVAGDTMDSISPTLNWEHTDWKIVGLDEVSNLDVHPGVLLALAHFDISARMDKIASLHKIAMLIYGSGSSIVAFGSKIWRFEDDDEPISDSIIDEINTEIGMEYKDWEILEDLYTAIDDEGRSDVLIGSVHDSDLHLERRGGFSLDPKSSILVKKVFKELKLNNVVYHGGDDEFEVSKHEIRGRVAKTMFHGTSTKYLGDILKTGLRPGVSETNYKDIAHSDLIFFTSRFDEAREHAVHTADKVGDDPMVVEFSLQDEAKLVPDYDINNKSEQTNVYDYISNKTRSSGSQGEAMPGAAMAVSREMGVYGYRGRIPAKFIDSYYILANANEIYRNDEMSYKGLPDYYEATPEEASIYFETKNERGYGQFEEEDEDWADDGEYKHSKRQLELPFAEMSFSFSERSLREIADSKGGYALIRGIPFEKITMSKGQGDSILRHLRLGRPSMTEGFPELFWDTKLEQLIVEDGNHRIFQAYLDGDRTFDAMVSSGDHNNLYRPVYDGEERFEWGAFPNENIIEDGRSYKIAKLHKIANPLKLGDLCEVRTNFEDADFWIRRKGSKESVGSVVKTFEPQHIGISVRSAAKAVLDSNYLYYALINIHSQGHWAGLSIGSLKLKHITINDVKNIPLGQ